MSWRKDLVELVAYLEAEIDFADEDIPEDILKNTNSKIDNLLQQMNQHLDERHKGEILRDGFRVAIIGAPNVGKSSLLNTLARRDVAIVSDEVGTTRDAIEVRLNVSGYPVIFTDTAGLRETSDSIEKKGIDVTYKKILESNLVLELFDNPTNLEFKKDQLVALNKCDQVNQEKLKFKSAINISAQSGEGIEELLEAIASKVKENFLQESSTVPTKTRYILGVQKTVQSLLNAKNVNLISQTELIVEELRLAINEIGRLTGAVDVEEYLEVIFRDFCIGK